MTSTHNLPLKYYSSSLLAILIGGIFLAVLISKIKADNHIFLLLLAGTVFATIGCLFLNLIYFLPYRWNNFKFLVPGILSILVVALIFKDSLTDLFLFEFFAITNLVLGIIWTLKSNVEKVGGEK